MSDRPPWLGGSVKEIATEEFCKREKITWSESTNIPYKITEELWSQGLAQKSMDEIETFLFRPRQFVISNMGKDIGKGVFLSNDAEPIKKDSLVIANYAGRVMDPLERVESFRSSDSQQAYLYNLIGEEVCKGTFAEMSAIDAKNIRGIASYMQCGMHEKEIDHMGYRISDELKSQIAMTNLVHIADIHVGVPCVSFYALCDINPGDQLLWSYGKAYINELLKNKQPFYFFNCDGAIIAELKANEIVPIENEREAKPSPEKRIVANKKSLKTEEKKESDVLLTHCNEIFLRNMEMYFQQLFNEFPVLSFQYQTAASFHEVLMQQQNLDLDKIVKLLQEKIPALVKLYSDARDEVIPARKTYGDHLDLAFLASFFNRINAYCHLQQTRSEANPDPSINPVKITDIITPLNFGMENNYQIVFIRKLQDLIKQTKSKIENTDLIEMLTKLNNEISEKSNGNLAFKKASECINYLIKNKDKPLFKGNQSLASFRTAVLDLMKQYNASQQGASFNPKYQQKIIAGTAAQDDFEKKREITHGMC